MKPRIALLLVALLLIAAPQVFAADLTAGTAAELMNAINAANADSTPNTIVLTADINLTEVNNVAKEGANALPVISTPITINGNGFAIKRNFDAPEFRFFYVTSSLTLNGVTLDGAFLMGDGGAIYLDGGSLHLSDCTFSLNLAGNGDGGAVYNRGGTVEVENCHIGSSALQGGGIYNRDGTVNIKHSSFFGGAENGGSIYNYTGTVTITDSGISGSAAFGNGGTIYNLKGIVTLKRVSVVSSGAVEGGGVYNQNGMLNVYNSTFTDDVTAGGKGDSIYNGIGATLNVNYATFFSGAGAPGGEIFNLGIANITNSIIYGADESDECTGTGIYNVANNQTNGSRCSQTPITGLELTATGEGFSHYHALLEGSNAINASGDCATAEGINGLDQRGVQRDSQCDIGAYEFNGTEITPTPTLESTVTSTPDGTPTATLQPEQLLITNGGFEDALDGWTVKNASGDKVKCNQDGKIIAHEGNCAYQFKGASGENSKLEQSISLDGFGIGDTLILSGYVHAKGGAVKATVKLLVKYADTTVQKGKITKPFTAATNGYVAFTGDPLTITSAPASVKLSLQHKSTSGKVWFDDLTLEANQGVLALP